MNKRHVLIGLGLTTVGTLAGFGLKTVLAEGIPSPNPLYYSGTLTEGGQPVNASRTLAVNLWLSAMPTGVGEHTVCTSTTVTTNVVNGRFRIALDSSCKGAINASPNVFVEVVDGNTSLGRSPIGAVPYAVEADHAVNATNAASATTAATAQAAGGTLAQQIVPAGAVMAFNLSACPTGWSAYAAAGGRAIIGVNPSGGNGFSQRNLGDTLGEEQHTMSIAEMPSHTHGLASGAVNAGGPLPYTPANAAAVTFVATTSATGGGSPFNNMQPSLALLYCQKN